MNHKLICGDALDEIMSRWKNMGKWREIESKVVQNDLDVLFADIIDFGVWAIKTNNMIPTGITMDINTGVTSGAIPKEWFPEGNDIVDFLADSIKEHRADYRAISIIWDGTLIHEEEKKVLAVVLEHSSGEILVEAIIPFERKGFFKKKVLLDFDSIRFREREKIIWDGTPDAVSKQSKRIDR